jgi:F-type H+-transporting ATPase subunit delta
MKQKPLVAQRYARAFFNSMDGSLDVAKKYRDVLLKIGELFTVADFRKVLLSPVVPKDLKLKVILHVVEQEGSDQKLENFIRSVVDAQRVSTIPDIVASLSEIINVHEGVVDATITSVVALSPEELNHLSQILCRTTKKKVSVKQVIDPEILGGLIVQIGNSVIDLSLKSRMDALVRNASW